MNRPPPVIRKRAPNDAIEPLNLAVDASEEASAILVDALQPTSPIADPRTVVAVAIPDSQLQGEEEEQVYILQQLPGKVTNGHGKKLTVLVLWIIAVAVVAAISVGVTCALGKCWG